MRKLKVVHYGIEHDHSTGIMECARKYSEVFEIAGIVEPDETARALLGGHEVYKDIPWITEENLFTRNDIDAVFCEGHELKSVAQAQKCIDHGLPVHLDKPGGTDYASFQKVVEDAQRKNLVFHMGYMYRYNPAMRYAMTKVKSGELGEITGIDGSFSIRHDRQKRRWLSQFPGGMMFFLGSHVIDMILMLNGVPDSVTAFNHSSDWHNDGSLDSGFAVLDYPHGACSVRVNATEANGFRQRHLIISGTEAMIRIEPMENPTVIRQTEYDPKMQLKDVSRIIELPPMCGRYDDMMLEFAACVLGVKKNPYSFQYELALQRTVLQACGINIQAVQCD